MPLLNYDLFRLHSGRLSHFKIDCDALTNWDYSALTKIVIVSGIRYRGVYGIPRGGMEFARELEQFSTFREDDPYLVVDDVLTSGVSFEKFREDHDPSQRWIGIVVFARGECPDWVIPIFSLNSRFWGI